MQQLSLFNKQQERDARFVVCWFKKPHIVDDKGRLVGFDHNPENAIKTRTRGLLTHEESLDLIDLLNDSNDVHQGTIKPTIHPA